MVVGGNLTQLDKVGTYESHCSVSNIKLMQKSHTAFAKRIIAFLEAREEKSNLVIMSNFSLYGTGVFVGLYYLKIHYLSMNLNKYPCNFVSIKRIVKMSFILLI